MLSRKAKYALQALKHLAMRYGQGPVLIGDIATQEGISQKFLESILLELRNGSILGSKKGKGGGYYLLKEPCQVPLSTVLRIVDGPIALLPCVSLHYYEPCGDCQNEATCTIKKIMIEVRDATLRVLENKTLADLTEQTCPPPLGDNI